MVGDADGNPVGIDDGAFVGAALVGCRVGADLTNAVVGGSVTTAVGS